MERTRGVGAEHERRRGQIIEAALTVAAEYGITAVTQARVAAAAGVSPGRVQHYFPSMTALLVDAFDQLNAASSTRIRALLGLEPDHGRGADEGSASDVVAPARRVLEVVLGELIPYDAPTRAHLQFRQSFTGLGLTHGEVAARLRAQYRRLHEHDLAGQVRRDQHDGLVDRAHDPVEVGRGLAALAEGLAYYVLIGVVDAADARRQVHTAIAALYDADPPRARAPGAAVAAETAETAVAAVAAVTAVTATDEPTGS